MQLHELPVIKVVDVETTGLDPAEGHKICELGWCPVTVMIDTQAKKAKDRYPAMPGLPERCLINPQRKIPPEASAVHHLTNRIVDDAPTILEYIENRGQLSADLFIAHNAPFDRAFLEAEGVVKTHQRWLCSMRLAKKLIPGLSYGNQFLRYYFGFETVPGDAHSAGHDANVTALVACRLLNEYLSPLLRQYSIDDLLAWVEEPLDLSDVEIGFGKHADKTWRRVRDIDPGYLQWITRQDWEDPDQLHTAKLLLRES